MDNPSDMYIYVLAQWSDSHFVFTLGLLDKLKESQPSRIVVLR